MWDRERSIEYVRLIFYSAQALPEVILRSNGSFVHLDTHDCVSKISTVKTDNNAEAFVAWKYTVN